MRQDLQYLSTELNNVIPQIINGGKCITKVLINISKDIYESGHEIKSLNDGMVSAFICENAQTKTINYEKDCSFTIIGIPIGIGRFNCDGKFVFVFWWNCMSWGNQKSLIQVKLVQGTVLYYTGYGIMHRQISLLDNGTDATHYNFWNVSSYANKRLYDNVIRSFIWKTIK